MSTVPSPAPANSSPEPLYVNPFVFEDGLPLDESTIELVAGFTCGRPSKDEERYERDVSRFITNRGPGGALDSVKLGKMDVQLFPCPDDERRLIGYAAIGEDEWELDDGSTLPLWVLEYAGVHTVFRFQEGVKSYERYGRRILGGMLEEVRRRGKYTVVGLFVDPTNTDAFRLYDKFGFKELDRDPDTDEPGREWIRMTRRT